MLKLKKVSTLVVFDIKRKMIKIFDSNKSIKLLILEHDVLVVVYV